MALMAFIKLEEKLDHSGVPGRRTNVYSKGYIYSSLNHRRDYVLVKINFYFRPFIFSVSSCCAGK